MTDPKRSVIKDVSWVLEPLLVLPHVVHALVLSGDGLVKGASPNLAREAREGASAMMSALQGAARAVAISLSGDSGTRLRQVVVDTDSGFVFAIPAGSNTVLAVFARREVDMGVVAHHMQIQVATLGDKVMTSQARDAGTPS
ncbi:MULTISPECIES: roadblock/LC7 domain-containing protein [unclassified Streptomyces]|uniref:roadblock/LC7 domain-containing protein n=1 Tax=unclassified Streptomyces TaxID=2593676 RepID=UPI00203384CE|nr:roadblock/LC7 domain-containing protein [Streptomyces sp. RKAG290]MCM2413313.1 roadblock/LC7 domain-containing protein [Streptomyces sp. RKAG290]